MPQIEIELLFLRSGDNCTEVVDFEADGDIVYEIQQRGEEIAEEKNDEIDDADECTDKYTYVGFSIHSHDTYIADPEEFDDLNKYAEYCEKVEEHGEAFVLRHADIGEHDFEDQYEGTWNTEEEFGEHMLDEFEDVPTRLISYIDMEKYTRDAMMDYSSYEGSEGFHIFRN